MIQIPVTSIANLQIGQAQDAAAGTGCTVILCPAGMAAGLVGVLRHLRIPVPH